MEVRNKKYISLFAYLLVSHLAFSMEAQIVQNGEKQTVGSEQVTLTHDFTEMEKVKSEFIKFLENLVKEGKLKEMPDVGTAPFIYLQAGEKALAKTGIIFDFKTEEDDKKPSLLKEKKITIENGFLEVTGNPWSYITGKREAIIENSKILLKKNRDYPEYYPASDDFLGKYYYPFISNGKKQQIEDIKTEKYITDNRKNPVRIINSLLKLKNSELTIQTKSDVLVKNVLGPVPEITNQEFLGPRTGLHLVRDGVKLEEGKYDLSVEGDIYISGELHKLFSFKTYTKESLLKWKENRFKKGIGTPLFELGENAKIKAKKFSAEADEFYNLIAVKTSPELIGITHNPKEDEMIVFRNNSEAEFENFNARTVNIKFEGGRISLKNEEESPFISALSQLQGKGIFLIEGPSILREGQAQGDFIDKYSVYTILELLPESKIDVSYIKDAYRSTWAHSVTSVKDEALKAGEYKFTLDKDTKTYLGYSSRKNYETIKNDPNSNLAKGIDVNHTSDADMHFKENSDLYLFREKYKDDTLVKNGEITDEKDEQGNLSEFTGRLTFDSNSRIHLRSNLKEEISDQLIATHYPILGEGAVLHLDNKGESSYTGQEKIVLVKANKGTSSKTKFSLQGGKVMLGDFDYHLYERLTEEGKEYYLAHGVVEGVLPEKVTPKKFISEITNIGDFISVGPTSTGETVKDKKIKAETTQEEYAISYHGDSQFENSQLAALGGKGILSTNAKLSLINSSLMSNQGLALEGTEEKELLTVDKGSSLLLENSTGGAALSIKNAKVRLNDVKKATLRGSYAIYSNGGNISGSGLFDIDGNIYHKGKGGINLTLEKGSLVNASMIDIAGNTESSKLHLKDGSNMFVKNYSNANMIFEKGSQLHLYLKEEADQKLDILQQGNRVIFTEPINFSNTDIYFRTNMDKEESDRLELLSTLTGTGANLHLNNHAEADMPSGGKEVDLVIAKTPENFKWNLANPVEVGGYFYNASLKKKSNGLGSDIISITVGDSGTRKATLSSTAKGMISNTVSDYIMHHSLQDSIFDSLYSNDYSSERLHSIWAKTSSDTFETKDYGMKNEANTILVGMDRALNAEEGLYGGFFAGNLHNTKKISSSSGKGSFQGFTGGLYLSYRGYLGFGDAFVAYTTGKSKYNVLDTASDTVTNDRNSKHLGAGLRFGRQFFLDSGEHFYLEPSAKITYGRLQGESSEASNGLMTKVDAIKSWTTGAYARAGYQNQFAFGKINSYAKVGVTQEILGKYNVRLNQNGVEQIKLDGNTMNYGLGCEYTIGNNTLSLDFDVKHSPVLKNHYKVSVGYQYKF